MFAFFGILNQRPKQCHLSEAESRTRVLARVKCLGWVSRDSKDQGERQEGQAKEQKKVKLLSVWLLGQHMPTGVPSCRSRAGLSGKRERTFARRQGRGERLQKKGFYESLESHTLEVLWGLSDS